MRNLLLCMLVLGALVVGGAQELDLTSGPLSCRIP